MPKKYDPGFCKTHKPKLDLTEDDVDARYKRGDRQEQCATCKRWLWPSERGHNFVSTGRLDTD